MSVDAKSYMEIAEVFARNSTCSRLHVGSILVRERRIISTGYNGAPAGAPHCDHRQGFKPDVPCEIAVHAEVNTIAYAAKYGIATENSSLFTTASPCLACAKLLINAGVYRVTYRDEFRDVRGLELLLAANVMVRKLDAN